MDKLQQIGYLRIGQIIGDPKKGIPAIIPVSRSTWWAGVASGRYPPPVKLSPRCTAWPLKAVIELVEKLEKAA